MLRIPIMRRLPQWTKYALWSAIGAVALASSGVIVWRVLGPAEVVTKAVTPYPSQAATPEPGPLSSLVSSPLIVDDRLRVYAAQRQVQADDQPDARYEKSPFWSFRRWPEQVIGVVHPQTAGTSGVPVVVSSWSDGALIGLDARTGAVAWHVDAEVVGDEFPGRRRTGSAVVWTPEGLLTGMAGSRAVVVTAASRVATYDAATGAALWSADLGGACGSGAFTIPEAVVVPNSCEGTTAVLRFDLLTGDRTEVSLGAAGTVLPLGCQVGASECGGLRLTGQDRQVKAWVWREGAEPVAAVGLATPSAWLAGDTAIEAPLGDTADTRALTGKDPVTGAVRWTWSRTGQDTTSAQVIAATSDHVLLLTRARTLITVASADGKEISRNSVLFENEPKHPYAVGPVYATGPYVAIERLSPDAATAETDDQYYYSSRPVLLAAG
jgi:outer membrane protein assembly factor BamB